MPTRIPAVTYEQAKALVVLDRTANFERARRELGAKSATSVMHLMGRMATTLKSDPLVSTTGDRVLLTSSGEQFLPLAKKLESAFDAFKRPANELRVTAYPSHAGALAAHVAEFIEGREDSMSVRFYEITDESRRDQGQRMLELVADQVSDIAIAPSGRAKELVEHSLFKWSLRVIVHKDDSLGQRSRIRMADLFGYDCLVSPYGHMSRELFEAVSSSTGVRPKIAMELLDQHVLLSVARSFKSHAAVMPDDVDGFPNPSLGPVLLGADGRQISGAYSVYYRATSAESSELERQRLAQARDLASHIAGCVPKQDVP